MNILMRMFLWISLKILKIINWSLNNTIGRFVRMKQKDVEQNMQMMSGDEAMSVISMMNAIEIKSLIELLVKNKLIKEKDLVKMIKRNEGVIDKKAEKIQKEMEKSNDEELIEKPQYIG